ncbi:aromatic amino acid lyase, partial [Nocardiopsis prasina]
MSTAVPSVAVGGAPLTPAQVLSVAREGAHVVLTEETRKAVSHGRERVEALARGEVPAYGVSTGFGALATRHIAPDLRARLQRSLIRSHAAGAGPEVEREVVRSLMLLRLRTLASGNTGVEVATVETLAALLNAGITPVVHEYG